MNAPRERTPFDSIEGSLEYIGLLREAIETAKISVAQEADAKVKLHARDRAQLVVFAYESGLALARNASEPGRRQFALA